MALGPHPRRRIVVPDVASGPDRAQRRLDVVPAALVLEAPPDQLGDEGATSASTGAPVECSNQLVVQRYVQTHGPTLAHAPARPPVPDGSPDESSHRGDAEARGARQSGWGARRGRAEG